MALTLTTEDLQDIANLLDEKLDQKLDEKLDQKLASINKRLDTIDNWLDKLESQTDALRAGQIDIRKELKALDDKISETYQVTLDAWGTSTENRKLLEAAN